MSRKSAEQRRAEALDAARRIILREGIAQVSVRFTTLPRQRTSNANVGQTLSSTVLLRTDDPTDVDRRPEC